MDQFWKILLLLLVIFAFVGVLGNAAGFGKLVSTFFGGLNTLAGAIIGAG